jgi:hypothetical protein
MSNMVDRSAIFEYLIRKIVITFKTVHEFIAKNSNFVVMALGQEFNEIIFQCVNFSMLYAGSHTEQTCSHTQPANEPEKILK